MYIGKESGVKAVENKITLKVDGMMCQHCVAHVRKALENVEGVKAAEVDLDKKSAVVSFEGNVRADVLIEVVKAAGYEAEKEL